MVQTPHMFWLLFIKYMLVLVIICDTSFILVSLCCTCNFAAAREWEMQAARGIKRKDCGEGQGNTSQRKGINIVNCNWLRSEVMMKLLTDLMNEEMMADTVEKASVWYCTSCKLKSHSLTDRHMYNHVSMIACITCTYRYWVQCSKYNVATCIIM